MGSVGSVVVSPGRAGVPWATGGSAFQDHVFGTGYVFRRCKRMSPYAFLAAVLSEKYDVDASAISPEASLTRTHRGSCAYTS